MDSLRCGKQFILLISDDKDYVFFNEITEMFMKAKGIKKKWELFSWL